MQKLKVFSPVILRIGLAIIFLWFGVDQFVHTSAWTGYIPQSIASMIPLGLGTLVHLNATFEIVFGAALLLGFFTRITAFLLMLHMIDITFIVGLNAVGMRDLGLSFAMIAVWLNGYDFLTLDRFIRSAPQE